MIIYNARRINFRSFSAHSLQILHMSVALNNNETLILLVAKGQKQVVTDKLRMMYPENKFLPDVCEKFVFKNGVYYTRNLNSAFLHFLLLKKQILELHHRGTNRLYLVLLKIISLGRFLAVTNTRELRNYYENYISKLIYCHNGYYSHEQNTSTGNYILHSGSLYKFDLHKFSSIINKISSQGLHFIHVGGTDDEIATLRTKVTHVNVDLFSSKSFAEVREYQKKARAFLYYLDTKDKNNHITSPLKLFEYLATEKPIICIGCGSISEILQEDSYYSYDDFMNKESISLVRPKLSSSFNLSTWDDRAKLILSKLK